MSGGAGGPERPEEQQRSPPAPGKPLPISALRRSGLLQALVRGAGPPAGAGIGEELRRAREEWEAVEEIQSGPGGPAAGSALPISFAEALQYFQTADLSECRKKIRATAHGRGLAALLRFLFGPPRLRPQLQGERELALAMAQCRLDDKEPVHVRILQTIYRKLTRSGLGCPRYGPHWEELGFQGEEAGKLRAHPVVLLRSWGFPRRHEGFAARSLSLEGGHRVQLVTQRCRAPQLLVLNICGRRGLRRHAFQCSAALSPGKFFLTSNPNLPRRNLRPFPRVLSRLPQPLAACSGPRAAFIAPQTRLGGLAAVFGRCGSRDRPARDGDAGPDAAAALCHGRSDAAPGSGDFRIVTARNAEFPFLHRVHQHHAHRHPGPEGGSSLQGVQPQAAGHRRAQRPARRRLSAALPCLEVAAQDHR